jgi:hypothetical protein
LAETVLPLFDPTLPNQTLDLSGKIQDFKNPKQTEACLPGNLYYFHFDRPHLPNSTKDFCSTLESYVLLIINLLGP